QALSALQSPRLGAAQFQEDPVDLVLLVGSLALILVGAELFTNGIEWFGHKLNLAEGAVGSVLAAVATAMPETLIPVIAIVGPIVLGGDPGNSAEVGVGAILGAPFMLSTLAMFVTGAGVIITQVMIALAAIIAGAQIFVGAVEHLSQTVGLDPRILALVIAPIATELPEKFNSLLWVGSGKDTLAMGNITGAMVFQSCIPTVLGIAFTEWTFGAASALSFASAGAAFLATALIFGMMQR